MTIEVSPDLQARIQEKIDKGEFADPNAVIEYALDLLDEEKRFQQACDDELKRLIAEGIDAVQQGKVREFTPELRESLWQQAIEDAQPSLNRTRRGAA